LEEMKARKHRRELDQKKEEEEVIQYEEERRKRRLQLEDEKVESVSKRNEKQLEKIKKRRRQMGRKSGNFQIMLSVSPVRYGMDLEQQKKVMRSITQLQ
jgi:hypothetical protein